MDFLPGAIVAPLELCLCWSQAWARGNVSLRSYLHFTAKLRKTTSGILDPQWQRFCWKFQSLMEIKWIFHGLFAIVNILQGFFYQESWNHFHQNKSDCKVFWDRKLAFSWHIVFQWSMKYKIILKHRCSIAIHNTRNFPQIQTYLFDLCFDWR